MGGRIHKRYGVLEERPHRGNKRSVTHVAHGSSPVNDDAFLDYRYYTVNFVGLDETETIDHQGMVQIDEAEVAAFPRVPQNDAVEHRRRKPTIVAYSVPGRF